MHLRRIWWKRLVQFWAYWTWNSEQKCQEGLWLLNPDLYINPVCLTSVLPSSLFPRWTSNRMDESSPDVQKCTPLSVRIGCMLPTASSADWTSCTIFISSVCPIQRNYGATRFPDVSCFQPDCSGMPCSHRTDFKGAEAGSTTRSSHVQSEVLMQIFKRRHNYEQWWLVKSIWRTTPGARPVVW